MSKIVQHWCLRASEMVYCGRGVGAQVQILIGQQFFLTKFFLPKYFRPKCFWTKILFGYKIFEPKFKPLFVHTQNVFEPDILYDPKYFCTLIF